MTQRLNITLLGHKDHGKSTLIGRLLCDTGSIKVDRLQEVREASRAVGKAFEYAFLLDSFREEREEGMTVDVIHAQIKGKRYFYDCIDVPGHRELIKNFLTGASHADAGILIVSAKEGVEEQTSQHLRLAEWLGIDQLIVAINKMDLIRYVEKTFEEMTGKMSTLIGIGLSGKVSYVPISAYEGDNVVERSTNMGWYAGQTLYEYMETLRVGNDASKMPLRLPVQDFYSGAKGEKIIVGRVESGSICVGQSVSFSLDGTTATVKAILSFNRDGVAASAGENIGIVCEPYPASLTRGDVCCSVDELVNPKREVMAHAILLESPVHQISVDCGTAQRDCEIEYLSPPEIGEVTQVVLRFREPIVVERSKTAIGRLAFKQHGKIIGAAVVM